MQNVEPGNTPFRRGNPGAIRDLSSPRRGRQSLVSHCSNSVARSAGLNRPGHAPGTPA